MNQGVSKDAHVWNWFSTKCISPARCSASRPNRLLLSPATTINVTRRKSQVAPQWVGPLEQLPVVGKARRWERSSAAEPEQQQSCSRRDKNWSLRRKQRSILCCREK